MIYLKKTVKVVAAIIENENNENGEQEIIEGSIFRNMEEETLVNEEEKESEHKIENIIWSDNKFPKV